MRDATPQSEQLIYAPLIGYPSDVLPIVITPRRLVEAPIRGYGSSPREVVSMAHQLAADFANAVWSQLLQGQAMPTTAEELLARCELPYGISLHRGDGQLLPMKVLPLGESPTPDAGWIRFDGELLEIDLADSFYRPGQQLNYRGPLSPPGPPPVQGDPSILIAALRWAPYYQRVHTMHLAGFTGARMTSTREFRTYLSWGSTTPDPSDFIPDYAESLQPTLGLWILMEYYKQLDFNIPMILGRVATSLADILATGQPLLVPCDADGVPYELVDPDIEPIARPRTVRWSYAKSRMLIAVVHDDGRREELIHGDHDYRAMMLEFAQIQPADPSRIRHLELAVRNGTQEYVKQYGVMPSSWPALCRQWGIGMRHHTWLTDEAPLPEEDARTISLRMEVCDATGELRSIIWDGVMRWVSITPAGDPTASRQEIAIGNRSVSNEVEADGNDWRPYGTAIFEPVKREDPTAWMPYHGKSTRLDDPRRAPMFSASWDIGIAWDVWLYTYGTEPTATRDLMQARSIFFTEREADGSAHPIVPIPPPLLPPIPPGRDRRDPDTLPRPKQFVPEFSTFTAYWVDEQVGIARVSRDTMKLEQYWLTLPEPKWRQEHLDYARRVVAQHEPIASLRPQIMAALNAATDMHRRAELAADYLTASNQLNEHRLEAAFRRCKELFDAFVSMEGRFPKSWDEVMATLELVPRDLIIVQEEFAEDPDGAVAPAPHEFFRDDEPMQLMFFVDRTRHLLMALLKPTIPAGIKYGYSYEIDFARGHVEEHLIEPSDHEGMTRDDVELLFRAVVPTDPLPDGA